MQYNEYGQSYTTSNELCDLLYKNPTLNIKNCKLPSDESFIYNESVRALYAELDPISTYIPINQTLEEFDQSQQQTWHMPVEYLELDIVKWILDKCKHDYELQRVGQELLLYQERDLFNLLRYLKYLVDTCRQHNIIWGVGRGSSVASYVLYLIGIHRIDSIYYDLSIDEFLK